MEKPTEDDAIRVLYSLGWADWDIAVTIKCSTAWVASRREELGLIPANRFPVLSPGRRPNPFLKKRPTLEAMIKAGPPPPLKKMAMKKCLKCRKTFKPKHRGLFSCPECHDHQSSSMADDTHTIPTRGMSQ